MLSLQGPKGKKNNVILSSQLVKQIKKSRFGSVAGNWDRLDEYMALRYNRSNGEKNDAIRESGFWDLENYDNGLVTKDKSEGFGFKRQFTFGVMPDNERKLFGSTVDEFGDSMSSIEQYEEEAKGFFNHRKSSFLESKDSPQRSSNVFTQKAKRRKELYLFRNRKFRIFVFAFLVIASTKMYFLRTRHRNLGKIFRYGKIIKKLRIVKFNF